MIGPRYINRRNLAGNIRMTGEATVVRCFRCRRPVEKPVIYQCRPYHAECAEKVKKQNEHEGE